MALALLRLGRRLLCYGLPAWVLWLMPSPSHWRDPADDVQRRHPREQPCAWCGEPAVLRARWAIGDQVRLDVPVCNADAAAVATGQFTITITCMDRVRTLRGSTLPEHDGHAHW